MAVSAANRASADERQKRVDETWSALSLEAQNEILEGALASRTLARHEQRAAWLTFGKALARVRTEAMLLAHTNNDHHPVYRTYYGFLMARVPDLDARVKQDKASSVHARWLWDNWPVIEPWLAGLEPGANEKLSHPSAIKRRFEASQKSKPQGAEAVPTPLQRKDRRIAELEDELEQTQARVRQLDRARDNLSEGRDWTWNDTVEDIAAVMLRLYPDKAKRLGSALQHLSKSTTRKPARKDGDSRRVGVAALEGKA
jgi:hypothetical protein